MSQIGGGERGLADGQCATGHQGQGVPTGQRQRCGGGPGAASPGQLAGQGEAELTERGEVPGPDRAQGVHGGQVAAGECLGDAVHYGDVDRRPAAQQLVQPDREHRPGLFVRHHRADTAAVAAQQSHPEGVHCGVRNGRCPVGAHTGGVAVDPASGGYPLGGLPGLPHPLAGLGVQQGPGLASGPGGLRGASDHRLPGRAPRRCPPMRCDDMVRAARLVRSGAPGTVSPPGTAPPSKAFAEAAAPARQRADCGKCTTSCAVAMLRTYAGPSRAGAKRIRAHLCPQHRPPSPRRSFCLLVSSASECLTKRQQSQHEASIRTGTGGHT